LKDKSTKKDKFAKREAKKYSNPIVSREFILAHLAKSEGPLSHRRLCKELKLDDPEHIEALRRRLIAMERDGQLVSNRKGAYGCLDQMDLIKGRVIGHREGFGFVQSPDEDDDVYLSFRQMRKVFSGDDVYVRAENTDHRGRREGAIVQVVAHNTTSLVGRYFYENGIHFVRPDNAKITHDVVLRPDDLGDAKQGQFVSVHITAQPDGRKPPQGKVIEVLGDHLAPGMEIDVAIRAHDLPHTWPSEVLTYTSGLTEKVTEKDKSNRHDLRHLPFVTIDGEDARDFDDAVYCETKPSGGWRLYVAIADVSHYVAVDSALDVEAQNRGNSVYFPDHVLPMLPEVLSNGLCSLKPQVDRLCMVCEITVSQQGRIGSYRFLEGVMHSHARLTYTQVGQMLDKTSPEHEKQCAKWQKVLPHIHELKNVYDALLVQRKRRGAIEFESTETRIIFDDNRKIEKIQPTERNDAHKIIEECMLAANVCTAKFLAAHKLPSLYRVHEPPKQEKMDMLRQYLSELGLSMRLGKTIGVQDFHAVLEQIKDRPDRHVIQTVLLRSMNQAVYQVENKGHFGLAYPAYTHFTSPIRRYPDLLVHRAIRHVIRSKIESKHVRRLDTTPVHKKEVFYPYDLAQLVALGDQCSSTERRADEATRDVVSWLKCEYLQDKVGEEYAGVISAVTSFGMFVELVDFYIEGLVHITALPKDYYHFEAASHRLVGERTRQEFKLGDKLMVRVARVDLDERKVDFDLLGHAPSKRPAGKRLASGDKPPKVGSKRRKAKPKKSTQSKAKSGEKASIKPKSKTKSDAVKPAKKTAKKTVKKVTKKATKAKKAK